jgi:hypothetical protein
MNLLDHAFDALLGRAHADAGFARCHFQKLLRHSLPAMEIERGAR